MFDKKLKRLGTACIATERSEGVLNLSEGKTGGVAEWLKAAVLKTVVGSSLHREFESHPHRSTSLCYFCARLCRNYYVRVREGWESG